MHRDANGMRKLIVAATAPGKVLALHNGDGRVVWAARYDAAAPPTHLLRWRAFHDLTHAPQLLLARAAAGASADGGAFASVVDGGTGRELERIDLGGAPASKIVPLPAPLHDGRADQFVYALIAADPPAAAGAPPATLPARLLPGGAAAAAHLAGVAPGFVFWSAFGPNGGSHLAGYAFDGAAAAAAAGGRSEEHTV